MRSLSIAVRAGASPALSTVDEAGPSSADTSLDGFDGDDDFDPGASAAPPSTPSRSPRKGKGRKSPATPSIRKPRVRPAAYVARPANAWILYRGGASASAHSPR